MVHSDISWEKYLPETYAYIILSNNKYAKIILFLILLLPICLCYTWLIARIIIDWIIWRASHCNLSSYASLPPITNLGFHAKQHIALVELMKEKKNFMYHTLFSPIVIYNSHVQ